MSATLTRPNCRLRCNALLYFWRSLATVSYRDLANTKKNDEKRTSI